MSNETIHVAFIGCGGNARGHGNRVSKIEGTEIVGLVDPSEDAIEGFKERVGLGDDVPTFSDHIEMLATVKPDAVVICDTVVAQETSAF